jgi:hypothetical protein
VGSWAPGEVREGWGRRSRGRCMLLLSSPLAGPSPQPVLEAVCTRTLSPCHWDASGSPSLNCGAFFSWTTVHLFWLRPFAPCHSHTFILSPRPYSPATSWAIPPGDPRDVGTPICLTPGRFSGEGGDRSQYSLKLCFLC